MVAQQTHELQNTDPTAGGISVDDRRTELKSLIEQKQALVAVETPDNPDVVAISRKIADLQAEIAHAPAAPNPAPAASTSNSPDSPQLLQLRLN